MHSERNKGRAGDASIDLDGDAFYHMLMNVSHVFTATNTLRTDVNTNPGAALYVAPLLTIT